MRVTYLKLENVAGIYVGLNRKVLEIDFQNAANKIVSIQGANGRGKTVLLSSITPFASTTSLDERSTLNYILNGKSGYKEIRYVCDEDSIVIKHYYKPNKSEGHSVKSYFSLNGEELNENGNVTSFLALVERHMGITQEMMRLIRLGTNVNSFVTLNPTRRKEYVGKLIEEIDMYMRIYKAIGEDIRVTKALLATNSSNIYNCHIDDPIVQEERLKELGKEIKRGEKERDGLIREISKLEALIADNDIDDLRRKLQDSESSIRELERMHQKIIEAHLEGTSVEQLIARRTDLSDARVDIQAKINSYRISIDSKLKMIERLDASVRKVTVNSDVTGLLNAIEQSRRSVESVPESIRSFKPLGATSDEVYRLITMLQSFNQIAQTIYSFGSKPIDMYLKLKRENRSVDKFLQDQQKKIASKINQDDVRTLLSQMFAEDVIIMPNCDTEYQGCPYYRFAETITALRDKVEEDTLDGETLRYIQVISRNIDNMLNEIDRNTRVLIPDKMKEILTERSILDRLEQRLALFDYGDLQDYMNILREHELYRQNIERLQQYESQLAVYKQSGVDAQMNEINEQKQSIEFYRKNIGALESQLEDLKQRLADVDRHIALVSRYSEQSKTRKILESSVESTKKLLGPLENAANQIRDLRWSLNHANNAISSARDQQRQLDVKLTDYNRLIRENEKLSTKLNELNIIRESVSTRKGIPVIYMKKYLGRIQRVANNLLKMIYDGELYLDDFYVTQDTFEIPYIKNGSRIPDVKFASQSENALMTMALSFALMNRATGKYNVLLLDEVDAGLDDENRAAFLQMLDAQMRELKAEQAFMISHNMSQMINIPMDCIQMSDIGMRSKLQNVIYK